jgi:DNA-binding beta-propeller fold protein YncE
VTFTSVYTADRPRQPSSLAFNPKRPGELWIVDYKDNSAITVAADGTSKRRTDPAAGHFMAKPTGIAFADDDTWATCGNTDNSQNGSPGFMGPAAFSADPTIFATQNPSTDLGSHLDMLHASSFCMGVAHEKDHAYWVFDGNNSALVRYDFRQFHPPGEEDHSDGEISFYAIGQVKNTSEIPSHLVLNPADMNLYVADTGNGRLVKLDITTGTPGKKRRSSEPSIPVEMDGTDVVDVVPAGTLQQPSGVALDGDILYVTDNATSRFYAFDLSGALVRYLDTELPAGSLAGITVGPDKKLYFVDMVGGSAYRIDVP